MELTDIIPGARVHTRQIERLAFAHDASIYRIVPSAVVRPKDESELIRLFEYARLKKTGITFRAAGTSLSGQTVTDGIVAETVRDWTGFKILDEGRAIRLQPGVIGDHANRFLSAYGRKIGPDPASIKAARIGGIVSNNASGMSSGIRYNSYNTMRSIRFLLANGNIYDTAVPADYEKFLTNEKPLAQGLADLQQNIHSSPELKEKIEHKYRIKNTLGYSLNAFLDHEKPLDIFAHLLIGAEGTLAFISEITLNTIPDPGFKATGLVMFDNLADTCRAIPVLKGCGVDALEMMDYASLTTARYLAEPPYDPEILQPGSAALLCEFQKHDAAGIAAGIAGVNEQLEQLHGRIVAGFFTDEATRLKLWKVRKSLFTTVGSLRKPGTSVITEDICFDVDKLADVVADLHIIFEKWNYEDAVIFGHAQDGNLHFVASIDLETPAGVQAYEGMLDDIADLTVIKYNGSLKAEHGTGRNMAPYLELEWGAALTDIMWRIKELADPDNILNPGVQLNRNRKVHIESLKPMPLVNPKVDLCVECGFCEPVCPSRELTLTPRNRITLAREIRHQEMLDAATRFDLIADYNYQGTMTCAVDGLCETACPVNINTGAFVKELRFEGHSTRQDRIADWTVRNFRFIQRVIRVVLNLQKFARYFGIHYLLNRPLRWINRWSNHSIPTWNRSLPAGARLRSQEIYGSGQPYVYYTSCINRTFGATGGGTNLTDVIGRIAARSGVQLIVPERIDDTCCGTPYSSKGFKPAYAAMAERAVMLLYEASRQGEIPVVVDTSPCTYQFRTMGDNIVDQQVLALWKKITFIDIIPFLATIVQDNDLPPLDRQVILHPTCSTQKMEQVDIMVRLAQKCATQVHLPEDFGCCGFAGDRGMLVPELTASATRKEAASIPALPADTIGYSSSRTCEVGMMSAAEHEYLSIAILVRDYLEQ
ncbi:MAG: FAD-binding and (Fe-S)-binding domain-containing protein [Candidatus Neomarinimicrobiota bacterium]